MFDISPWPLLKIWRGNLKFRGHWIVFCCIWDVYRHTFI